MKKPTKKSTFTSTWTNLAWLGNLAREITGASAAEEPWSPHSGWRATLHAGLTGRNMEMAQIQEEVAAEQQGMILLASRTPALLYDLLAQLRQQPAPPPGTGSTQREGLFLLVHLPNDGADEPAATWPAVGEAAFADYPAPDPLPMWPEHADCLLYLWQTGDGWQAADSHWCARLRTLGAPLITVALGASVGATPPALPAAQPPTLRSLPVVAGRPPLPPDQPLPPDLLAVIERILAVRPRLAIALAQEAPGCRQLVLQRVVRLAAALAALLGSEPLPLLDLPLHMAVNWKMALQIATIYGRSGLDYRSRELWGAFALNIGVRTVAQQLAKLIPLFGWLLSATISGATTWLLGQALVRIYEQDWLLAPPHLAPAQRLHTMAAQLVDRARRSGQTVVMRFAGARPGPVAVDETEIPIQGAAESTSDAGPASEEQT